MRHRYGTFEIGACHLTSILSLLSPKFGTHPGGGRHAKSRLKTPLDSEGEVRSWVLAILASST